MKALPLFAGATTALLLTFTSVLQADDWPQFRGNAGRTASSNETLPAKLHLQWMREFPTPRPAFPTEVRLRYDASYEPVAAGELIFVPSMITDSVTAYEVETGKERWHFIAAGPVRFAPAVANGRVYLVSDDGYLYCLGAEKGELQWKFRGLPAGRKDRSILGHGRLVSLFPARGGLAIHEGVVYFGAGLWPGDGVFVHAVDAETGKARWSNTDSNQLVQANFDHGIKSEAGITPQGYLAVAGDKIVVPCGAQLAAVLDRKTGKLDPYTSGWGGRVGLPKGSWFVAADDRFLLASGDIYDLNRPNDEGGDKFKRDLNKDGPNMVYPSGLTRLLIDPSNKRELGNFREPVISKEALFYSSAIAHLPGAKPDAKGYAIAAFDLTDVALIRRQNVPAHRAEDKYPDRNGGEFKELWRFPSSLKVQIRAGSRLYAGGKGIVQAIDFPSGTENQREPAVSWQAKIEGTPHRMLAANGKLFVITLEGRLYAFGAEAKSEAPVYSPPQQQIAIETPKDEWKSKAAKILSDSKQSEGYVIVLGLDSGRLVEELATHPDFHVIAIDEDPAKIAKIREQYLALGLYGDRVQAIAADPLAYPFPPYLANLVVTEKPAQLAESPNLAEAVYRLLRPYGGTAALDANPKAKGKFEEAQLSKAAIRESGDLLFCSREGALKGATDWSHREVTPGNAGASQDLFLRSPLGLLWFGSAIRWQRKKGASATRIAEGRVFINAEKLYAIDAYTGRNLWQVTLPKIRSFEDITAVADTVYVMDGKRFLKLDASNGRETGEIKLPEPVASQPNARWESVRIWKDYLVGTSREHLFCLDRHDGSVKWHFKGQRRSLNIAVGAGKVYCAVLMNVRAGETRGNTYAFDIVTGKQIWENDNGYEIRHSESQDILLTGTGVRSGQDGSKIRNGSNRLLIAGPRLVEKNEKDDGYKLFDLSTGALDNEHLYWNRRGCTSLRFSPNLATTRYLANAAYVDLATQKITPLWNIRNACSNNLFPADGLLNMPNLTGGCECNYTPTAVALVPLEEIASSSPSK